MSYVQFSVFRVNVLYVHQFLINLVFLVYILKNKHATNLSHVLLLDSYNNWNIIHLTPKSTYFEVFDEIHQVVLDVISDNMASLFQSGMYGFINTDDTTTNVFYVIQFISEAYTLQNSTQIDVQVISADELVVKAQYLCSMQENYNWYCK